VDESEFVTILKVIGRDGNTLSDNVRKAWDGRRLQSMTRNSPLVASDPHISIIGNIPVEELRRNLTETEAANGFINRFLLVCAKRSKLLPDGGRLLHLGELTDRLARAAEWARAAPRQSRRDAAATALWRRAYAKLAAPAPGLVGSILARAEAHLLRLSCIYAALDMSETVTAAHLRAAIAVWRYAEESTRYIFGDAVGDHVADRILDALLGDPDGLTKSEILRLFGSNVPAARVDQALGALLAARRTSRERTAGEHGRPVEVWRARPVAEGRDDWDAVLEADDEREGDHA
jgi:hypothetical protein